MRSIEKDMVKYLNERNTWTSSRELMSFFNISLRTLRTTVKNINEIAQIQLIQSSRQGYRLMKSQNRIASILEGNEEIQISERKQLVLKEFLISKKGVDPYEIAENLFVSEQTVFADIQKIKADLKKYNCTIKKSGERYHLRGAENDIRRLFSNVVYEETQKDILSVASLKKFFPAIDIHFLKETAKKCMEKFHLTIINDYRMNEFLLHVCILLDRRTRKENHLVTLDKKQEDEYRQCAVLFLKEIQKKYFLPLDEQDINEIYSLFSITTRSSNSLLQQGMITRVVDKKIVNFVRKITRSVYNEFFVDLNNDDFIDNFSLHLNTLLNNKYRVIRNPLLYEIKNVYPIIYEISVFIGKMIQEQYPNLHIHDDEISYIALHVGTSMENKTMNRISTVIVNPKYLNLNDLIRLKIENQFPNDLHIVEVVSDFDEIVSLDEVEMIISTYPIQKKIKIANVVVSIFINEKDIENIYNVILSFKQLKGKEGGIELTKYFDGTFHYFDILPATKDEAIKRLCSMQKDTDETFYQRILVREEMSSAEYLNMAIAHPIRCNEKRTFITVGVFCKPMLWKANKIDIVLVLSVAGADRKDFLKILSRLIKIFTSEEWKNVSHTMDTFEKFISFLKMQEI